MRRCTALLALSSGAFALQPLQTPSRSLRRTRLHVTGSEDAIRDDIARRNAARADAPLQLVDEAVGVPRLGRIADGEQAPLQVLCR